MEMNNPNSLSTPYSGGEAQYSFRMFATYDQPICCTLADPRVVDCVISKVDPSDRFDPAWLLTIRLGPVSSVEEIAAIGNAMQDDIFDRLPLALDLRIDHIRMVGHSLTPMPGGGAIAHLMSPMPSVTASGRTGGRELLADDVQALQNSLTKAAPPSKGALVALYRSALATDDPVAKFLILYLIVYEKSGNDRQEATDKLISDNTPDPGWKTRSWVDKKGVKKSTMEAIYTRLRNEITHRTEVETEKNRAEIIAHLDAFQKIVRQILQGRP
jgi:hypothetical protein